MGLRAILVCVEYSDILARTLDYNHHHFSEIMIVTAPHDRWTIELVQQSQFPNALLHITSAFYDHGATFNKWAALEEGLDAFGRHGILCVMDADVFWPRELPIFFPEKGNLYVPKRHMMHSITDPIPAEDQWEQFPLHRNWREFSGYSQIFHADDPHLGPSPWHQTNWKHAGGADSFFAKKWPGPNRIRPPFEVLHIGKPSCNWCGRVSEYSDGSKPVTGSERHRTFMKFMKERRRTHGYGHERF